MTYRQLFLVCYDISDPPTLRRVHRTVRAFAIGGQKSFYECWLTSAERRFLQARLLALMDEATDRVHFFQLDPRRKPLLFGVAKQSQYQPFLIV